MIQQPQQPTDLSKFVTEMDFGDDPSDIFRKMRLQLKVGQRQRVAILDKKVFKAMVHYFNQSYVYCLGEGCPLCGLKAAAPRYLTTVLLYNMDQNGKIIKPVGGVVKVWLFGRDKYGSLASIKDEWDDIRLVDILLECTEEKFQRFNITPARESLWQSDKDFGKSIIAERQILLSKLPMEQLIARHNTAEQMRQLMSQPQQPAFEDGSIAPMDEPFVATTPPNSADLQSMLDQLGS